jgi:tetratricopeptide (TPR) repeat protein
MTSQPAKPVELFFSYSHKDEKLRDELEAHLAMLKREGVICGWHDRKITAGKGWDGKIREHLNSADVILLLVSSTFLASDYCYDNEVNRAMERHLAGDGVVIPVILRPCDWTHAPFSALQALPKNARPVFSWKSRDDAFLDVVEGIRRAVEELRLSREDQSESRDETAKATTPSAIPRPPSFGFVARRDEKGHDIVGRLKEELAPGRNQSATLSGPGGIGKSTLAAETARELQEAYRNRIVWSSAEGRTDFALPALLDDIATQLGHAELRTLAPAAKDEQVRALVAEAPALVVVDNYETVADGEKKRIEAWFKAARCSALFTSRPKVAGTVFVPVSAMSRDECEEFLSKVIEQTQDSKIFTAAARRRVYETAEANPFVMQWVVGQIDDAQETDEVLEELSKGKGDAAERVFDRSYNLLDDDGRDALLALSLFTPSATREALAEVSGFDEERAKEAVRNLNRLWLIKTLDEHHRFAVEGLTRSMAAARLSKDARNGEFRRRFVAYFLLYAVERKERTPENYDALEGERDNLLGVSETAFASEDWVIVMAMAFVLANPVDGMLSVRGYWGEAIRIGEQALQAARSSQDEREIAGLSHNLAVMYEERGELVEARSLYDESLEIYKMLDLQSNIAVTLHQLGKLAQIQGETEEARRLYGESLEIEKRLGNQGGVATTLHNLAALVQDQGELEEARRLYDESLKIKKRLGDQGGVAITLHQLGRLAEEEGNEAEAARLFREALSIFERLGSPKAEIARASLARVEGESS